MQKVLSLRCTFDFANFFKNCSRSSRDTSIRSDWFFWPSKISFSTLLNERNTKFLAAVNSKPTSTILLTHSQSYRRHKHTFSHDFVILDETQCFDMSKRILLFKKLWTNMLKKEKSKWIKQNIYLYNYTHQILSFSFHHHRMRRWVMTESNYPFQKCFNWIEASRR